MGFKIMAVIEGGGRFSQLLNSPFLLFWALVSKAFVVFWFLRKIDLGLKFFSIKVPFSYKVNAKTGERTFPLYFSRLFFDKGLNECWRWTNYKSGEMFMVRDNFTYKFTVYVFPYHLLPLV